MYVFQTHSSHIPADNMIWISVPYEQESQLSVHLQIYGHFF